VFILHKSNNKQSSRRQINIKSVEDGILMLPKNEYRIILRASSINFELRSEDEKDALIDIYQSVLNSLPCAIQILIRIREVDMSDYLESFQVNKTQEKLAIYRQQVNNYCEFVEQLVKSNKILSRNFYIVIPYSSEEDVNREVFKEQLKLRTDIVGKGLERLGIRIYKLSSLEILDLFYAFYSQDQSKTQAITNQTIDLLKESYF
jgi:hypothetical protein